MTWTDPIVDEVRRVREEYARQFNFDIAALVQDIQARQAASGRTYVDLSGSRRKQEERSQPDSPTAG